MKSPSPAGSGRSGIVAAGCALLVFLALGAWVVRGALNPDGVAYLRLASYYAAGQWDLAVSGYWGPLFSWLAVAPLAAGAPPLLAGRLIMALSGVVFWLGCVRVWRAYHLPAPWVGAAAWLAAAAAAVWSTEQITPDLLQAGFLALGLAPLLARSLDTRSGLVSGAWLGAAYLAKAVTVPLAGVLVPAFLILRWARGAPRQTVFRCGLGVAVMVVVVVLPWATVLSLKYDRPILSTGGPINHAIAGPADVDRSHPFLRVLQAPPPGRLTSWEDPTFMEYAAWSPFASGKYLRHQIQLGVQNLVSAAKLLTLQFPLWFLLVPALFVGSLRDGKPSPNSPTAGPSRPVPWWTGLLVPAAIALVYLPFRLGGEDRYFYSGWPFLLASTVLLAGNARQRFPTDSPGDSLASVA